MRAVVLAAAILALAAPGHAETPAKPKAESHKPAKRVKKRRNDGTDDLGPQRCRDVRTHSFTKCGGPYAEPVPAN